MYRILFLVLALLPATMAAAQTRVPDSQVEMQLSFVPLVKQAAPAVVNSGSNRLTAGLTMPTWIKHDDYSGQSSRNTVAMSHGPI